MVINDLPATDQRRKEIMVKQGKDEIFIAIITYCSSGLPDINTIPSPLKPYWHYRGEFNTDHNGLLLCRQRIVIPSTLLLQVLDQLHLGHQGITKCRQWAEQSIWWPGLSTQLAECVRGCTTCAWNQTQGAEPLLPNQLPSSLWQKIADDFFKYKLRTYLLVVDYYSSFIELALLSTMTSSETIWHLLSIFARHCFLEELVTDNGSQFTSHESVSLCMSIRSSIRL